LEMRSRPFKCRLVWPFLLLVVLSRCALERFVLTTFTVLILSFVTPSQTKNFGLPILLLDILSLLRSGLESMRNSSWKSLLAASLFVAASKAQTLDSVLSGQSTLSTFYSLIQVCCQVNIDLGTTSDYLRAAIPRHYSTATF
jgi:general stress protein CsbA